MATSRVSGLGTSQISEKDAALDSLYWVKQLIAVVLGITAGYLNLTGFPVLVIFGIFLSALSLLYGWQILKADEVEAWDIVTEAFGPCVFCFVLLWTLTYTFL